MKDNQEILNHCEESKCTGLNVLLDISKWREFCVHVLTVSMRRENSNRAINVWLKKLKTILPKYVTASFHSLYCEKEEMEEGDKQ